MCIRRRRQTPNALRNIISRFETHARIFLYGAARRDNNAWNERPAARTSRSCFTARLFSFMLSSASQYIKMNCPKYREEIFSRCAVWVRFVLFKRFNMGSLRCALFCFRVMIIKAQPLFHNLTLHPYLAREKFVHCYVNVRKILLWTSFQKIIYLTLFCFWWKILWLRKSR